MSCILYPMGAYLAIARAATFKACALAVGREPFAFAEELFELNARAYLHRYGYAGGPHEHATPGEIAEARADTESDYAFDNFMQAEEAEPGEAFKALHDLLGRVRYQCADAEDYEMSAEGTALELAVVWAATEAASPRMEKKRQEAARATVAERERLRAEAVERGRVILDAARPKWAQAAIVAEFERDECDTQSDYFATSTARTVVLAWSKHTRDLFSEMRKAAALLPETAHMGPGKGLFMPRVVLACDTGQTNGAFYRKGEPSHWHRELYGEFDPPTFATRAEAEAFTRQAGEPEPINFSLSAGGSQLVTFAWEITEGEVEHREKYSMGAGYYLKRGGTYSTGWTVSKVKFYGGEIPESLYHAAGLPGGCLFAPKPETPKAEAAPQTVETPAEVPADVTREGDWTWISFPAKPPQSVIDRLKTAGARWSRKRSAWYFSRPVDLAEIFPDARKAEPETHTATCDACGRTFEDESAELAADMRDAHKAIAHREPVTFTPEPDSSARVTAFRPRAEFRRTPDDEPEPTGTDGGGRIVEPGGEPAGQAGASAPSAVKVSRVGDAFGARCLDCDAVFTELTPWHWRKSQAMHERGIGHRTELFALAEREAAPATLTATRDTLRALKLINDAAVLELKRAGETDGRTDCARVTLNGAEATINVARVDKWAATFEPGAVFSVELDEGGLTLTRGTSFVRFAGGQGIPCNLTPIELRASESGEVTAPALPSPAEMKVARKILAEGRKAMRAERVRQNALRCVNSATADLKRAEEYAARLEDEAQEVIQQAEELTEAECDEAVILAKRARDLRRLRRAVEVAAEDPQANTPEFFEWLADEHRAAYAEAFETYEKATRRDWHRKAETARKAVGGALRRAFNEHVEPDVAEIAAEDCERYGPGAGGARVFGPRFDTAAQSVKRTLRQFPGRILSARERVGRARVALREALGAYAPHAREGERERIERIAA